MIPARHTPFGRLVAGVCAGPLLDRAFREVRIQDLVEDPGLPVLMLANHFSWWDGFIQYRIDRMLFRRKIFAMMLEEQLRQHRILARCGCFSVRRSSRSILTSLDYAADLMRSAENMLLLFPQGKIESIHLATPGFGSGIDYLRERIGCDYAILLNVNLPDYGSERKPTLYCYLRILDGPSAGDGHALRGEWERFYADCKKRRTEAL
ncbi:lysophospholipid acyltransferase family protein [Alistipes sp.]|uniref:lysophospholipid acyltransferase family protein n=1 Tax=Alistipes sp. TaxID=1872444 RepID=UPI003AEFAD45